jgi:hypothetical protein
MEHVLIPTSFFLTEAKHEYSDYQTRLVQELLQNSLDAGATEIRFNFTTDGYSCEDNGHGMSKERMVSALLTMGGSEKATGSTGGFGAAKKLLLFAHASYSIHSLNTLVNGSGLTYSFSDNSPRVGTKVSANYINPDDFARMSLILTDVLMCCDLDGRCDVYINGDLFGGYRKYPVTKEIEGLGTINVSPTPSTTRFWFVSVLHNGLFMFKRYVPDLPSDIYVNVYGKSVEIFSQNRDSFRGDANKKFETFINELSIDKKSFSKKGPRKHVIKGINSFMRHICEELEAIQFDIVECLREITRNNPEINSVSNLVEVAKAQLTPSQVTELEVFMENHKMLSTDFHFDLSDSDLNEVPKEFIPRDGKKMYSSLAATWQVCIREVLKANNISQSFVVGFTFGKDTLASHRMDQNDVSCYLINPTKVKYTKGDRESRVISILLTAVHEVTHSLGNRYHDENFSCAHESLLEGTLIRCPGWRKLLDAAQAEVI